MYKLGYSVLTSKYFKESLNFAGLLLDIDQL